MSNIYKIKDTDIQEFLTYRNTNKVILFYKQNCVFCKIQIDDLNKIANMYNSNVDYAIVDVTNKRKFCLDNDITCLPTIHIYEKNTLKTSIHSYQEYEKLLKQIEELDITKDTQVKDESLSQVTGGASIDSKEDPDIFRKRQEEEERLRKITEVEERERVQKEIEEAQRKAAAEYDNIK